VSESIKPLLAQPLFHNARRREEFAENFVGNSDDLMSSRMCRLKLASAAAEGLDFAAEALGFLGERQQCGFGGPRALLRCLASFEPRH
jgi:hypothetical protein